LQSPQQQQALGEELSRAGGGSGSGEGLSHGGGGGSGGLLENRMQPRPPAFWSPAEKAAFLDVFKVVAVLTT
jgi:hypothetical protein